VPALPLCHLSIVSCVSIEAESFDNMPRLYKSTQCERGNCHSLSQKSHSNSEDPARHRGVQQISTGTFS
ncbi:hypothetical protein SK128_000426, partial [Halocaridina rubra]